MAAPEAHAQRQAADDAACAALVRDLDIDRYYSSLFASVNKRAALLALYAFNAEIVQVRARVSDPLPGEVRLQWWRDVIAAGAESGEAHDGTGHPVAAALERTIRRHFLPRTAFEALIDAHVFDLYDDPMPTTADLEGHAGDTSAALIRLASLILADGADAGPADAAGHGGVAHAVVELLRALPRHAARGQVHLPADMMERHDVTREAVIAGRAEAGLKPLLAEMRGLARHHLRQMQAVQSAIPKQIVPAFLPLALCEGYLARMETPDYDPFRSRIERLPLARLWVMWRGLL